MLALFLALDKEGGVVKIVVRFGILSLL